MHLFVLRFFAPLIIISACLYGLNQLVLKPFANVLFFNNYFNDLLFPLLFVPFVAQLKFSIYQHNTLEISLKLFFTYFILISVWFELLTPLYQKKSTGDLLDIAAYFTGTLIVIFYYRRKTPRELHHYLGK